MKTFGRGLRFDHLPTDEILESAKPLLLESIRETEKKLKCAAQNIRFNVIGLDYVWRAEFDVPEAGA